MATNLQGALARPTHSTPPITAATAASCKGGCNRQAKCAAGVGGAS